MSGPVHVRQILAQTSHILVFEFAYFPSGQTVEQVVPSRK